MAKQNDYRNDMRLRMEVMKALLEEQTMGEKQLMLHLVANCTANNVKFLYTPGKTTWYQIKRAAQRWLKQETPHVEKFRPRELKAEYIKLERQCREYLADKKRKRKRKSKAVIIRVKKPKSTPLKLSDQPGYQRMTASEQRRCDVLKIRRAYDAITAALKNPRKLFPKAAFDKAFTDGKIDKIVWGVKPTCRHPFGTLFGDKPVMKPEQRQEFFRQEEKYAGAFAKDPALVKIREQQQPNWEDEPLVKVGPVGHNKKAVHGVGLWTRQKVYDGQLVSYYAGTVVLHRPPESDDTTFFVGPIIQDDYQTKTRYVCYIDGTKNIKAGRWANCTVDGVPKLNAYFAYYNNTSIEDQEGNFNVMIFAKGDIDKNTEIIVDYGEAYKKGTNLA